MPNVRRWFLLLGLVWAFLTGCRCGGDADVEVLETVQANATIVEAHTAGLIGRDDAIRVVLVPSVVAEIRTDEGPPPLDGVLVFDPVIPGSATWTADNEITFLPDEPLPNGQVVHVQAQLSKLGDALKDA
ncbi:MAG: hypothetical protein AAF602_05080, partial [Myxococcota bacterium]